MAFWTKKTSEELELGKNKSAATAVRDQVAAPQIAQQSGSTVDVVSSVAAISATTVVSATPAILGVGEGLKNASVASSADANKIRCALGAGTYINGKLSFDTSVQIDGKMKGELFSSKTLIVGKGGIVEGDIDVACLVLFGTVRGKVRAAEKIELKEGALLEAEVYSPAMAMDEGAVFNGNLFMGLIVPITMERPAFAKGPEHRNADAKNAEKTKEIGDREFSKTVSSKAASSNTVPAGSGASSASKKQDGQQPDNQSKNAQVNTAPLT